MGLEDRLGKRHGMYRKIKRVLYPIYEALYRAEAEGNRSIEGPAVLFFLHPHAIDYAPVAYAVDAPITFVYRETKSIRGFKVDPTTTLGKLSGCIPLKPDGKGIYREFCNVLDKNGIVGIALQDDSGISDRLEVRSGGVELCLWYQFRRRRPVDLVPVGLDYSSIANKVITLPRTNIPVPLVTRITARIGDTVRTELPVRRGQSVKEYAESIRKYADTYAFVVASEAARLSNLRYDSIIVK